MRYYNNYVVINRLHRKVICGDVNLSYGTECFTVNYGDDKAIACDKGIICYITSQTAYDYLSQNDDGEGRERGRLVKGIINRLQSKKSDVNYQKLWDKIWEDTICQKYKRPEHADHWLWNYDFYNAPLCDLQYIARMVGIK